MSRRDDTRLADRVDAYLDAAAAIRDADRKAFDLAEGGLVQIYSRLHQVTGDETCRAAARDWLARLLGFRVDEPALRPSAGFYQATREGPRVSLGLLDGAAGIGLVLLGATCGSPRTGIECSC